MKVLMILILIIHSLNLLAKNKGENGNKQFQPSVFEVLPKNSPVKGKVAIFTLKFPLRFEVEKVKVKLVNANDLESDQKDFVETKAINNIELHIPVAKLSPGFYRLYVSILDKKSKREQKFQTKHHDFVRFVIDESKLVPIPEPKKNNATIGGIDSDNDGIRDDVQIWINNSDETYEVKQALKQAARGIQLAIINAENKEQAVASLDFFIGGINCLIGLKGYPNHRHLIASLKQQFLNTLDRTKAFLLANHQSHGSTDEIPMTRESELSYCQF